jgi:hypothetical protein
LSITLMSTRFVQPSHISITRYAILTSYGAGDDDRPITLLADSPKITQHTEGASFKQRFSRCFKRHGDITDTPPLINTPYFKTLIVVILSTRIKSQYMTPGNL